VSLLDHCVSDGEQPRRHLVASDPTLGSWQPRPIKAELFTSPTHHSSVEDLVRTPEGNLCLSAFSMHCDHDLTLAPLFMLVSVKAATVLGQPFPKCGTFHRFVPMYQVLDCVEPGSASLETWALCEILRRLYRYHPTRAKAVS
jgi:hypothetical protein